MSEFALSQIQAAIEEQTEVMREILAKLEQIENHTGSSVDVLVGIETNTI